MAASGNKTFDQNERK